MGSFDRQWLFLSLICAFSLASADALTKKFFTDYSARQIVLLRFGAAALFLFPLNFYCPLPQVPVVFWICIAVLVPFEILAMWLYMEAIRRSPLHLTLPYLAFTPVFNVANGYIILGEKVTGTGFIGILLVVAGAYLLNLKPVDILCRRRLFAPFLAIFKVRGSRLMLAVALIYSFTSVVGKQAMLYATPISFAPFYFSLIGLLVFIFTLLRHPHDLRSLYADWQQVFLVGLLVAIMVITHFIGVSQVEVSYFIAMKRSSLLFGIVYGALLFNERSFLQNLLAGAVMLMGMTLVMLG